MAPLDMPRGLQAALFAGAIAWEALGATLFWRVVASYRDRPLVRERASYPPTPHEVFLAYQPEGVHRAIFFRQVATLLLLHLTPAPPSQPGIVETVERASD